METHHLTKYGKLHSTNAEQVENSTPTTHQPRSLFTSCLRYVTTNLDMVESLVNFPEEIGRQIFLNADEFRVFDRSPHLVRLFCEAYHDSVLERLCLRKCHLLLGQKLEYLSGFKALKYLDLSNCWLGEEHDVYHFLAELHSLTHLNLSEDNLTDRAIQRMTLQMRMYRDRGPRKLEYLDISGNTQLTIKCLKYLTIFASLAYLDMSGAKIEAPERKEVASRFSQLFPCAICQPSTFVNKGWAANVIQHWIDNASTKLKEGCKDKVHAIGMDFYKEKRRHPLPVLGKGLSGISCDKLLYCAIHESAKVPTSSTSQFTMQRVNNENRLLKEEDLLAQYITGEHQNSSKCDLFSALESW